MSLFGWVYDIVKVKGKTTSLDDSSSSLIVAHPCDAANGAYILRPECTNLGPFQNTLNRHVRNANSGRSLLTNNTGTSAFDVWRRSLP